MNMLMGFAPFLVFALGDKLLGMVPALCIAALLSAGLLLRDWLVPARCVKLLEMGTTLLFGGLAAWAVVLHPDWSVVGVRLRVDAGLLLVVLASLAMRKPFTLSYARERVPTEVAARPAFLRLNNMITAAWAVAFAVMVIADVVMVFLPAVPLWIGVAVTAGALFGAFRFTQWYPAYRQRMQEER